MEIFKKEVEFVRIVTDYPNYDTYVIPIKDIDNIWYDTKGYYFDYTNHYGSGATMSIDKEDYETLLKHFKILVKEKK